MSTKDVISESLRGLHSQWDEAVSDLTPEQLAWRPDGPGSQGNHIAFTTWHAVRTVDNVVRFILQDRRPTVWLEGGFDQKFGLDRIAQGTGMPPEQAAAFRLPALPDWMEYQRGVWKACEESLSNMSDADLEKPVTVRPLGEMPARRALMNVCVTHCFTHLGEVYHLRALMGLKTTPV
jgi:hypothetical protein